MSPADVKARSAPFPIAWLLSRNWQPDACVTDRKILTFLGSGIVGSSKNRWAGSTIHFRHFTDFLKLFLMQKVRQP